MRRQVAVVIAVLVAVLGLGLLDVSTATAALPATAVSIVRPVTVSGHPVAGYRVVNERGVEVGCGRGTPTSPAAVDRNIRFCGPSAAYAVACWRAAWAHHVLCLPHGRSHRLDRFRLGGPLGEHTAPPRTPAPLDMVLGNGAYCTIRAGGAAAHLRGHPKYATYYFCSNGAAVWAPQDDPAGGVRRGRTWTVRTAPENGHKAQLVTRRVAHAWLVGTRY